MADIKLRDSDFDQVKLGDSVELIFGDGVDAADGSAGDISIAWDGTDLDVLQTTANSSIKWGVSGAGIDQVHYGDTAAADMTWDQSADSLIFGDNAKVVLGTGSDITIAWDGTDLDVTQATANSSIKWGVSGAGIDQVHYGDTAAADMTWDQSADSLIFGDNAKVVFGTGSDVTVAWDGTDLDITAALNNSVLKVGNGTNSFDVWLYGSAAGNYILWDASANTLQPVSGGIIKPFVALADPGNAGAIPVTVSGYVPLVTAGAETRTLAAPTYIAQRLLLYFKTDGGDCVVTCSTTVNETGNNTVTFSDTGEATELIAVEEGGNLRWRTVFNDGAALTTV